MADFCMRQGDLLLEMGDTAAARSRYEEGLALRRAGEYSAVIAHALVAVGRASGCQREHGTTQSHALEALGLFQEQENKENLLAALENQAAAALAHGRRGHAARLARAVETLRASLRLPGASGWRPPRDRMGEAAVSPPPEADQALTRKQAALLALDEEEPPDLRASLQRPARETDFRPGAPDSPIQNPKSKIQNAEDLTEEEWARIAPLLPAPTGRRGRPYQEHRRVINGILWVLRTDAHWRDLPAHYGPWHTCHNRYQRWCRQGLWDRIVEALQPKGREP
jgi:hypothetical protein